MHELSPLGIPINMCVLLGAKWGRVHYKHRLEEFKASVGIPHSPARNSRISLWIICLPSHPDNEQTEATKGSELLVYD